MASSSEALNAVDNPLGPPQTSLERRPQGGGMMATNF
jgi:hypothetical protein